MGELEQPLRVAHPVTVPRALDTVRDEVESSIRTDKARQLARHAADEDAASVATGARLEELAEKRGLTVEQSKPLTAADFDPTFGPVRTVVEAATRLDVGETSDVVETPLGLFILRPTEKTAAKVSPLEDVRKRVVEAYKRLEQRCDFVLCEGTDFVGATPALAFGLNADLANELSAPVLVVVRGASADETLAAVHAARASLRHKGCAVFGVVVTRVPEERVEAISIRHGILEGMVVPVDPNVLKDALVAQFNDGASVHICGLQPSAQGQVLCLQQRDAVAGTATRRYIRIGRRDRGSARFT